MAGCPSRARGADHQNRGTAGQGGRHGAADPLLVNPTCATSGSNCHQVTDGRWFRCYSTGSPFCSADRGSGIEDPLPSEAPIQLHAVRRAFISYAPVPASSDAPSGATDGLTATQEHERPESTRRPTGSSGATSRTKSRPAFARQPGLLPAGPRASCPWASLICPARPREFCQL